MNSFIQAVILGVLGGIFVVLLQINWHLLCIRQNLKRKS